MAYSACTSTTQGNTASNALTVTKPSGTADGDLLVAVGYLESGSNSWSSVGAGFNSAGSTISYPAKKEFMVQVWTKIAATEPATWLWTPASVNNWRIVNVMRYSGATGTGNEALDVTSGCSAAAAVEPNQIAPSVNITTASDLLVCAMTNFTNAEVTTACGAANIFRLSFGGAAIADKLNIGTGNSGCSWGTGQGTQDYAAMHVSVKLARAGAATGDGLYHGEFSAMTGIIF